MRSLHSAPGQSLTKGTPSGGNFFLAKGGFWSQIQSTTFGTLFFNHTTNKIILEKLLELIPFTRGQRLLKDHCYTHGFHHAEAYNEYWRSDRHSLFSLFQTTQGIDKLHQTSCIPLRDIFEYIEYTISSDLGENGCDV